MRRSLTALSLVLAITACAPSQTESRWSQSEIRILKSLSLLSLGDPPPVASNSVADDPRAVEFGRALFFDQRLSENGQLSCASCHRPELHFTDGLPRGKGIAETARNTPSIVGGAWQTWFYWDGRRDSLWAQALIPIEAPAEMGGNRLAVVRLVGSDAGYRARYEALFGRFPRDVLAADLPTSAGPFATGEARDNWHGLTSHVQRQINAVYANLGKSIGAFERTVIPHETPFDRYVATLVASGEEAAAPHLAEDAIAGAKLFIDPARTQCMQCHNGPLLTNGGFHNVGSGTFSGDNLDYGRMFGLQAVMMDEFNCLGTYSDANPDDCHALRFVSRDTHNPLAGAFKTPSLRNVAQTGPYLHDGRFDDLMQVMQHYNSPPPTEVNGEHELRPMELTELELAQLVAFMQALNEPARASRQAEPAAATWSSSELSLLATFSLSSLPEPPPDRGNRVFANSAAVELGAKLFFERRLSRDGSLACANCHQPEFGLADGQAKARGLGALKRNAIGLTGVAHNRWFYWDGRKDSLWSQALEPIETRDEMGGDRTSAARYVLNNDNLSDLYQTAFGPVPMLAWTKLPARASPLGVENDRLAWSRLRKEEQTAINRVFSNLGKSIAAYERNFVYDRTRFDAWLATLLSNEDAGVVYQLSADEAAGLKLFISGSTMCVTCHNGPRFTDGEFHNIGTGDPGGEHEDQGRRDGRERLAADEFNCASLYSDDYPDADCTHLETMQAAEVAGFVSGSFRTPGLRNLVKTAPYMHDGRFATLEDVLAYYVDPTDHEIVRHELSRFVDLDGTQIRQLAAFLRTLSQPAE